MEQELANLFTIAKRALANGQQICQQANSLAQESEKNVQSIDATWPKILFANHHILVQLKSLELVRDFLFAKADEMRDCVKAHDTTLTTLSTELDSIFTTLRSCFIAPGILAMANHQRRAGEEDREGDKESLDTTKDVSLFHYISDQDIYDLQRQASDQIGEVETICSSLETMAQSMASAISDLSGLRDTALSISLDEPASDFTLDQTHLQDEKLAEMATILSSLTDHYDQLEKANKLCESDPTASRHLDISVLQKDDDMIPNILDGLDGLLLAVQSTNDEITVRMQVYQTVLHDLANVLSQLEQLGLTGGQVDMVADRMMSIEGEMKDHEQVLKDYFDHLESLAAWYRMYASSYSHLVLEIERRRKVSEKQERLRKELIASFEEAYNDELQERQTWLNTHGTYLPEDLCPFIIDLPGKLTVQVAQDFQPLPELSSTSIEKALSNIHQAERSMTS